MRNFPIAQFHKVPHTMHLARFPRIHLAHLPTPLEPLPRLSAELGGPEIWIKRDDCTGLAGGGNKTRKLEFLLGDAFEQGADTLVTQGAVQSNHVRQTAAAAAAHGLACEIILEERTGSKATDYVGNGNVLLDRLFGATLRTVPGGTDMVAELEKTAAEVRARGGKPYIIPGGGSNPVGALGYVDCAREIVVQADELDMQIDRIITATGSAGTHAGLVAGLAVMGADIPVLGIGVTMQPGGDVIRLGKALVGRFSDGEVQVEIEENVRRQEVFVIQSTSAPTAENFMELLVLIDALKRASVASVTAVVPYFGYARQDRRMRSARVPITAKVAAKMFSAVGTDRVLTVAVATDRGARTYLLRDGQEPQFLGETRLSLIAHALSSSEPITYTARDGLPIHGYLTLPAGVEQPRQLPMVLLVHGGPWARDYTGWDVSGWVPFFTSRGYAVLRPQYRGSTDLGRKLWLASGSGVRTEYSFVEPLRWIVASLDPCVGVRYEAQHA